MRSLGTTTLLIALAVLPGLAGCGSDGGDADDVPTITTRPSTATSTTSSASPSSSASTSSSAPTASSSATSAPTATQTTVLPSETPTETGPSPEPPTDQPSGPTTYRAAVARIDGGSGSTEIRRFSTPEDVVYCLLDDPVIGPACELRRGFVKDDEVCGGAAEGVGRVETYQGEARPVCNTDTIREPGAQVISDVGVVLTSGADVRCLVEAAGVTCVDSGARTGFFLGPREYHVF